MSTRAAPPSPGIQAACRLSWLTATLMGLAAVFGLLAPSLYRDNALVSSAWRGNDVVTLVVAVPVLLLETRAVHRGSRSGQMVLLGMLLYALYGYAFYLFGAAFNVLFLVYVAVVTAAAWGLMLGLRALDVRALAQGFRPAVPAKAVGLFMLAVGLILGSFWTALSLIFLRTGELPAMVAATGHPTNVTGALDLSIVVPLAMVGGGWVWKRRPWGYVLAVVWNVKVAMYMLALSAATISAWRAGATGDLGQLALWLPIGFGCVIATAALLGGYRRTGSDGLAPYPSAARTGAP